ncbi:venom protease-like isoform X1 [Pollicipes pollicipes]|nr:venom protease-like isoform X1 [Pollicipes pollicipes]
MCQTVKQCSRTASFTYVLRSIRTRLCYWRSGQPFICCPAPASATTSGRDFWPTFSSGRQPERLPTVAPLPPLPASPEPSVPEQEGGEVPMKETMDQMPTVKPFPMEREERVTKRPRARTTRPPSQSHVDNICGRSDPVVVADPSAADILRHLHPDVDPLFSVAGGAFGKEARVAGGSTSVSGRWPWMAVIGKANGSDITWLCGGSIIDEYHVITAAHCVQGRPNVVHFGDSNIAADFNSGDQSERRRIAKITLHPRYRPPRAYHDLAVVTLRRAVQFSRRVRPICLPPADLRLRRGQTAKITGHGYMEFNGGELTPQLQEAQIKLVRRKVCNASYARLGDAFFDKFPNGILSHVICAGQEKGGVDACQGDSGGPLMQHDDVSNTYYQIGVIGSGFGCGNPEFPGLYTSIKHHLNFIRAVTRSRSSRLSDLTEAIVPRR